MGGMSLRTDLGVTRSQRLDRLPFTSQHRRLVIGSGLGWALDAMDVGLISFVMAALATQWGLGTGTLSWIASVGFVGMAIGAGVGGLLADRVGRRQVFALTLLVYGTATGLAALSWSVVSLMASASSWGSGSVQSFRSRPLWSASSHQRASAVGWWWPWRRSGPWAGR